MSHILIADPNPLMRRTIVENIRPFGHVLHEAETGMDIDGGRPPARGSRRLFSP